MLMPGYAQLLRYVHVTIFRDLIVEIDVLQPATPARRPGILHRINDSAGRVLHPDHIVSGVNTTDGK